MEYNNYYPVQSGHPPPPNQPHGGGGGGGPQMQHQHQAPPLQQGGQIMQSMPQQQNTRPQLPPGPTNHHQQMQQMQSQQQQSQQHIVHHTQQQHPNYQQIQPPHQHGPTNSHSGSPHTQQQQQQQQQQHNHNHQPNMPGQMPSQQNLSQHVHPHSPHHHHPHGGPPPMHIQQQQTPQHQSLNQMVRPQMGPSVTNQHTHAGPQQSPGHHHMQHQQQQQQNFYSGAGGGAVPQSNIHHYPPNQHHHLHHQAPQQHHPPPVMHHAPPPSQMQSHPHLHSQPPQSGIGRNSPYYPNILQTEFRIIELNRRLQCRPAPRHPYNPLPGPYDDGIWWERFALDFFEDDATLTLRMLDDKPVEYTIGRTLIPRFFRSYFDGGVTDLSISLRNPKETCINPHMITLDCDQAFIVTNNTFRHPSLVTNQGVVVHTEGHLILDFVSNNFDNLSIKSWRFYTRCSREFIDRSILNTMGLPNNHVEPITRQGFTKSTITYLKMCMIMEPMQELMFQNRHTKLDPRSCLRKLLFDRYKFRSGEDNNRTATNKRRKRKPSAVPAIPGTTATTNKKSKAGINNINAISNNVGGVLNNMIMSPSSVVPPNFPLASQDVMVVGEPSMMGGDFGDDNERMITRLENTQYDPTASTPTNEESDSLNAVVVGTTSMMNVHDDVDSGNMENHHALSSPSMIVNSPQQLLHQIDMPQEQQEHHLTNQHVDQYLSPQNQQQSTNLMPSPPQERIEDSTTTMIHQQQQQEHRPGNLELDQQQGQSQDSEHHAISSLVGDDIIQNGLVLNNPGQQENLIEKQPQELQLEQEEESGQREDDLVNHQLEPKHDPLEQNGDANVTHAEQSLDRNQQASRDNDLDRNLSDVKSFEDVENEVQEGAVQENASEEINHINSISNSNADNTNMKHNITNSAERTENHTDSIQTINAESNSNSQLPCSTANATTAMEQQQPVDNGVA